MLGNFGKNLPEDSGRKNVSGYETSENLLPDYGVIESELGVDLDFFWDFYENLSGSLGLCFGMPVTMQITPDTQSCKSGKAESNEYSQSRTEGLTEWKALTPTYSSGKVNVKVVAEDTEWDDEPRNCNEHQEYHEDAVDDYHRSVMFTILLPEVIWVFTEESLGTVR